MFDVIVIGGGAAGYYFAIHLAEQRPGLKIAIFERNKNVLNKVRISGGGRCNVTNAEVDAYDLVKNYPRGEKELLGPFHYHMPSDVFYFFQDRGVPMKIEPDGRVFPKSNSSQSIIDCLVGEANRLGISVYKNSMVKALERDDRHALWHVGTIKKTYQGRYLMVASGSSPKIWQELGRLGHTIVKPIPSLFTFLVDKDERLGRMPGVSTKVAISVIGKVKNWDRLQNRLAAKIVLKEEGPMLITHTGFSGPAVLRLSAWGARLLHSYGYRFQIKINWAPQYEANGLYRYLLEVKENELRKTIARTKALDIPNRLWVNLVTVSGINKRNKWADIPNHLLKDLGHTVTESMFWVKGRSPFKEEFVTAGGVDLKEIDFKTNKSKKLPNTYLAGEVINVDGITGGFNFQNAWTGAYLAAQAMAIELREETL